MGEIQKYYFDGNSHYAPAYTCSMPGDNSGWFYGAADADAELSKLRAENQALREALEAVEWQVQWHGLYRKIACSCCGNYEEQGHTTDCHIGNALKQARSER